MTLVFTADTLPNVTWLFNDEIIELVDNTGFSVIGPFQISKDSNRYKVYTCMCTYCNTQGSASSGVLAAGIF